MNALTFIYLFIYLNIQTQHLHLRGSWLEIFTVSEISICNLANAFSPNNMPNYILHDKQTKHPRAGDKHGYSHQSTLIKVNVSRRVSFLKKQRRSRKRCF